MSFEVKVRLKRANTFQAARLRFGTSTDVVRVRKWAAFLAENATGTAKEAAEYAKDSVGLWEKHHELGRAATSPEEFAALINAKSRDDIALLLIIEAAWWQQDDLVAFAYLRRTWTGSFYMEYLAKHPLATYSEPPDLKVSSVTEAFLVGLASLIDALQEDHRPAWLWWESTEGSARAYERYFAPTTPKDLVIVSAKELAGCRCQIIHQLWQDGGLLDSR